MHIYIRIYIYIYMYIYIYGTCVCLAALRHVESSEAPCSSAQKMCCRRLQRTGTRCVSALRGVSLLSQG